MAAIQTIPIRRLTNCTLTVHVHETREYRVRRAIAVLLVRAAGWVLGMRTVVTTSAR